MSSELGRVLFAVAANAPAAEWIDAATLIESERTAVETLLHSDPLPRIYGFTTLLGHLDAKVGENISQSELLEAHLVGTPSPIDGRLEGLITACKLEQLHHGGSGIHPDTYRSLLRSMSGDRGDGDVALLDSYGSGDVVPAAWWIRSTFGADAAESLAAGDLIALLNGSFVSTAVAVNALLEAADLFSIFLTHAARVSAYPTVSQVGQPAAASALAKVFAAHAAPESNSDSPQRPISLRDASAYITPIAVSLANAAAAIEHRLSAATTNPVFVFGDDGARAESQSGFFDPTLTFALTNVIQAVHLVIGATQRLIQHACEAELAERDEDSPRYVQPPKVAQAIVERAALAAGQLPLRFSGADSNGVEDLRDLSLLTANSLNDLVGLGFDCLQILDSVVGPWSPIVMGAFRDSLTELLAASG